MGTPYDRGHQYNHATQFIANLGNQVTYVNDPNADAASPYPQGIGHWSAHAHEEPAFAVYNHSLPHNFITTRPSKSLAVPAKRRRTRSGCFTCRSRRVKCDEKRPICDRCRKGNRDCSFPPASNTSATASASETQDNASQMAGLDDQKLDQEQDEDELNNDEEHSSTDTASNGTRRSDTAGSSSISRPFPVTWSHLDPVQQKMLSFHQDHLNVCHYVWVFDPTDFVHGALVDIALGFEPLLDALVAFSAYHYTLRHANSQFKTFWELYCHSVESLRVWLTQHTERHEPLLLAIFQLSMIDHYLGDWTNVSSHLQAATSVIESLYTPATVMQTDLSRTLLSWHARLDHRVRAKVGAAPCLSRDWHIAVVAWHRARYVPEEMDADKITGYLSAKLDLALYDVNVKFALFRQNLSAENTPNDTEEQLAEIGADLRHVHIMAYGERASGDPNTMEQIVEPGDFLTEGLVFDEGLRALNPVVLGYYSLQQLYTYRKCAATATLANTFATHTQSPKVQTLISRDMDQLNQISVQIRQLYDRMECQLDNPADEILDFCAPILFAVLFFAPDPANIGWSRKRLAGLETSGYVMPRAFRQAVANRWRMQEVEDWWLPERRGKLRLIDEYREVVEERDRDRGRGAVEAALSPIDLAGFRIGFQGLYLDESEGTGQI